MSARVVIHCISLAGAVLTSQDGEVTIRTCDYDAGAICSLTYKGKQFLDNYDHGRQMQSAVSFDGRGEVENPTEAGSRADGKNPRWSSSALVVADVTEGVLTTQSIMAYWEPLYGRSLSGVGFSKRVESIRPRVLKYEVTYQLPLYEVHKEATFESLTAYMPGEFRDFYAINLKDVKAGVVRLGDGPGEQSLPIIFSTTDQAYAMGVWSPGLQQPEWSGAGYGRWRFGPEGVVKWNAVYRVSNPKGSYTFTSYVFVGTLASVIADMKEFKGSYHDNTEK